MMVNFAYNFLLLDGVGVTTTVQILHSRLIIIYNFQSFSFNHCILNRCTKLIFLQNHPPTLLFILSAIWLAIIILDRTYNFCLAFFVFFFCCCPHFGSIHTQYPPQSFIVVPIIQFVYLQNFFNISNIFLFFFDVPSTFDDGNLDFLTHAHISC